MAAICSLSNSLTMYRSVSKEAFTCLLSLIYRWFHSLLFNYTACPKKNVCCLTQIFAQKKEHWVEKSLIAPIEERCNFFPVLEFQEFVENWRRKLAICKFLSKMGKMALLHNCCCKSVQIHLLMPEYVDRHWSLALYKIWCQLNENCSVYAWFSEQLVKIRSKFSLVTKIPNFFSISRKLGFLRQFSTNSRNSKTGEKLHLSSIGDINDFST